MLRTVWKNSAAQDAAFRQRSLRAFAGAPNRRPPVVAAEKRYVPYIPPHAVVETVRFLQDKDQTHRLLRLITSPREPEDSETQREVFTRHWERYRAEKRLFNAPYRQQESHAELSMWRAVSSLPNDLHAEAAAESERRLPLPLRFHYAYRFQLLKQLSDYEKRCLQVFQNLMYIRFPFLELKRKHPEMFWISQLGSLHRKRIAELSKNLVTYRR